jgi:DNA invertase Pin-like site-specific DNA recombinase
MPVIKPKVKEPEPIDIWNVKLPLNAIWGIYARQSTPAQLIKNTQSTEMQTDDLEKWIEERNLLARKICLFDADLGVSGTLRIDQRTGLQELVARIEADEIKVVLVYQISRLFRDETGVQYNVFATKCKEHNCLLVTADGMVFNFNNPMHLKMFRYLAEIAAEFIPQQINLLHQARLRRVRQGFWAGQGTIASGYIVDYNEDSATFEKITPYQGHRPVIFSLFERYYELGGNFHSHKSCVHRLVDCWRGYH